jgi:hypothetical protein
MGKFYGAVGYVVTEETVPGSWMPVTTERNVYGDMIKNTSKTENSGNLNDNVILSNKVSFIADPYALKNFQDIKYVKFMGTAWKVTLVDVEYPRLILTLGVVYNE